MLIVYLISGSTILDVLRVVRHGREVKAAVDSAIDRCAQFFNLRDSIEDAVLGAEEATDEHQKRRHVERGPLHSVTHRDYLPNDTFFPGIQNLRRYFELVIFQAYLDATPPDTLRNMETFEAFVKHRPGQCPSLALMVTFTTMYYPVFQTFEQEIFTDGIHALQPLERMEVSEGLALSDEVKQVVTNRSGSVLSASTILKSDFFSNLQKLSLPEYVRYQLCSVSLN